MSKQQYQIVILDNEMPVLDGVTTAKILKSKMKNGEIEQLILIGSSANPFSNEDEDPETGAKVKIMDYLLPKPIMQDELIKIFKKIINNYSYDDQLMN